MILHSAVEISQEKAEKWAKRRNQRTAEKHPLFAAAGILDQVATIVKPSDLIERNRSYFEMLNEQQREQMAAAAEMRQVVGSLIGWENLAAHDERRPIYPNSSAYSADMWWQLIRQVDPALAEEFRPETRHIEILQEEVDLYCRLEDLYRERRRMKCDSANDLTQIDAEIRAVDQALRPHESDQMRYRLQRSPISIDEPERQTVEVRA